MATVWYVIGWLLTILFGLVAISMMLTKNWLQALLLFLVVLLVFPPVNTLIKNQFGISTHPILRIVLILLLLSIYVWSMLGGGGETVYKSPQVKERFYQIYGEKMKEWPVAYEDHFLETQYGKVHVIVSGSKDSPALLLLHASGISSWSWKHNVEELSKHYRTYAVDLIGDAGKSEFASLEHTMKDGRDQAVLYTEIADKLEIDKAYIVGSSEGGFIGSNIALYAPERVEKLALLGPMGYSGAIQSVFRIMFAQYFPLKPVQESTFRWAFSNNPDLLDEFGDWFELIMTGYKPAKVAPLPLKPEQRKQIKVPVLFVFGERDNLVGNPQAARELVQDIPDVQVEIVQAGHLMGAEIPEQINTLILAFFSESVR